MTKRKSTSTIPNSNSNEPIQTSSDSIDDIAFPIEKGDAQHLTDFQLEKAKYFFHVNLDIENKEYVTWEDVEFYLLFHATAAGKEGSDGGDLEVRLNRAAKIFWDHVHDQVPLPDNKRDTLTLDQFLDAWAGLIDYVVRTNQLPPIIQDLVKLGFELYATDNGNDKQATIQPAAFDQLFQKMNIGRPYAIMAYKYLTENGTKPLDADKIDSLVKAVITSSDDEHDSHFLLPGFFKTISSSRSHDRDDRTKSESPGPEEDLSQASEKSSSTSTSSSSSSQSSLLKSEPKGESSESSSSSPSPLIYHHHEEQEQEQQKQPVPPPPPPPPPSSSSPQKPSPSPILKEQQKPSELSSTSYLPEQNSPRPTSISTPRFQQPHQNPSLSHSPIQRQDIPTSLPNQSKSIYQNSTPLPQQTPLPSAAPRQPKMNTQQEDENIRSLLRYYHIDDGDIFEVADGPRQRLVLIHPERPVPPYIQKDKHLLTKLLPETSAAPSQRNGTIDPLKRTTVNGGPSHDLEPKQQQQQQQQPAAHSETFRDPLTRIRQEQARVYSSSPTFRSEYSNGHSEHKDEHRRTPKRYDTNSLRLKKKFFEESSMASDISSSRQEEKRTRRDRVSDDEEKIVATVLKHLAPIVEKRVAEEIRRIDGDEGDETDQDEDDTFIPFPFMLTAGLPFFNGPNSGPTVSSSPHDSKQQQQSSQQNGTSQDQEARKQTNGHREPDFSEATFIPPPLFMAMMGDLARGSHGGEISGFPPNLIPPSRGPAGVEGFMMFVDDNQMRGSPAGFPSRSAQRF